MSKLVSSFNQLLTALILFLWSFLTPYFPKISSPTLTSRLVIPIQKLENISPEKYTSTSAVVPAPATSTQYPVSSIPWGTTEKIGEHEYRTYLANDPTMGTPDDILAALNVYRKNHGVGSVRSDENICKLAKSRAEVQQKLGHLDGHKGLVDYMNDQSHWENLDIKSIGENASYGYILSGTHLIEWVFDADSEHRDNQLNPNWNLACAGTSAATVDIIFGQR